MAGVVACVAPTLIATRGQLEFARTQMQLGTMSVLLPAMLEGAAWLLAWRRHQAVSAEEPAGRLTAGVWLLAAVAAALNLWHGASRYGVQVGVAYGLASLVGFGLVELLVGHQRRARAETHDGRARRPRGLLIGLARPVRYPRLSWAAWSRRVELGPGADPADAWRQAWSDRFGVELGADAAARRRGRVGVRAERRAAGARQAVPVGGSVGSVAQHGSCVDPGTRGAPSDGWALTGRSCADPAPESASETCTQPRSKGSLVQDSGAGEEVAAAVDVPGSCGDVRVRELADLLVARCPVTGAQAAALYAVSSRTGRRLLSDARALLDDSDGRGPEPPAGPATGEAAGQPRPLALVAAPARLEVGA